MSKKLRILIILLVFAIGTFGYYFIEGNWTLLQAFYMMIITITTVGYGEVKPLSPAGEVFTVIFIILGLSTAAVLATQLAAEFIEKNFKALLGANKMRKKIQKLRNHYVICGFGDVGSSISTSLKEADIPFVIIENSTKIAEYAQLQNYLVVSGKATYDATLLEAGIKDARGIVICLGDDSLNMYVSLAARELNPELLIIVRGYKADGEKRMIRAGANSVIYPLKLGGQQMAQLIISEYSKDHQTNHLEVTTSGIMGYSLRLYKHFKDNESTIADILSSTGAVKALTVEKQGGVKMEEPPRETVITRNDQILLLIHDDVEDDRKEDADVPRYNQFAWDEAYDLGIPVIDEEHRQLLSLVNTFIAALHTKDERKVIVSTFDSLIEYTKEHFKNEEMFMKKYKYPELSDHKKKHLQLTREVMALNKGKDYIFSDTIADFLISWLTNHIMGEDKKYADYILSTDPDAGK